MPAPLGNLRVPLAETRTITPNGVGPARMGNANLFKAVGPASIGGEYPECLGTVISVDRASALCTFLSPDFAEDAATDCLAHNLVCVLAARDRSAFTVNNIAAHLHCGQPAVDVALSGTDRGCLSFNDSHETRDRSQVCGDGDCLMRGDQFVKLDGDACPGTSGCRGHLDDVTQNPTYFLYSHAWGQGNILHNPARDHLAYSAFPGRKG